MNRRQFVQRASVGTAVLGTPAGLARAATGANDRIRLGLIGVGGRGTALLSEILTLHESHNVTVAALCDVFRPNLEIAARRVQQKQGGVAPARFTRYQEMLALKDVDAVTIATPDFGHGTLLLAALQAGKDVYVEKPMTIDLAEANAAVDLAQVKRRSCKWARSGAAKAGSSAPPSSSPAGRSGR